MHEFNGPVDWPGIKLPDTPNFYLSAPEGFTLKQHAISPIFNCSLEKLESVWNEVILRQPRITCRAQYQNPPQSHYIVRSKWCRFPDIVVLECLNTEAGATFVLLSGAKYGHSDFGVNRKRALVWIETVRQALAHSLSSKD